MPGQTPNVTTFFVGPAGCGKTTLLQRLRGGKSSIGLGGLDVTNWHDHAQPLILDMTMYGRRYRLQLVEYNISTAFESQPDVLVLCFDIGDRDSITGLSLDALRTIALTQAHLSDNLPTMLLGLKRDCRSKYSHITPQEGWRLAQDLHCNLYAECSAMSGELMQETAEDMFRLAARTTTPSGAINEPSCTMF